ncbi:nucleobindin-2 [Tetranychus urticae]|uniref:nucleobindin-2 n=1 Tax=Tetranychus urticae TaxID=32264 RepID=UPI00077BC7FA|nr:nucleobindin-2 [Tetranychus urticae]
MMTLSDIYTCIIICLVFNSVLSAPVEEDKKTDGVKDPDAALNDLGLEYGRYLQEVVAALEEDKEFAKKLENVSAEHIQSGAIANELNLVSHNIRTKLDELKRIEIERLRKLTKLEHDIKEFGSFSNDGRRWRTLGSPNAAKMDKHMSKFEHLDHKNPHSFEVQDLHKLIIKATRDLEELDKKRREEFKKYEMEKEHRYRESLKNMTEEQKTEAVKKHSEMNQKHKEHPRVHHPGSKQQLEEVWEEQDRMPKEEFNPKTFFSLHDVNGDGYLDPEEVEALLTLEIKKMYDPNNPEDDPNEMEEEYHRMREHVYKEADKNKDGLISQKEFIELTQKTEFERDEGWKGIDEQQMFNEDELRQYEARRQELLAQQYGYYMPPYQPYGNQQGPGQGGYHQQPPQQHFGNVPPYQVAQQQGYQKPNGYQAPPQFAVHPGLSQQAHPNQQYNQNQNQNLNQNQNQNQNMQHLPPPPPPPQPHYPQVPQQQQQNGRQYQQPQYQSQSQGNQQNPHFNSQGNLPPQASMTMNQGAPPRINQQSNFGQPSNSFGANNRITPGQQQVVQSSSNQGIPQGNQSPPLMNQNPNSNMNQGSINSIPQQNSGSFNSQPNHKS